MGFLSVRLPYVQCLLGEGAQSEKAGGNQGGGGAKEGAAGSDLAHTRWRGRTGQGRITFGVESLYPQLYITIVCQSCTTQNVSNNDNSCSIRDFSLPAKILLPST